MTEKINPGEISYNKQLLSHYLNRRHRNGFASTVDSLDHQCTTAK